MSPRPLVASLILGCLFAASSPAYGHGPGMGGFSGASGMHGGFGAGHGATWLGLARARWHALAPPLAAPSRRLSRGPIRSTGDPTVLARPADLTRSGILPILIGAPAWPYATPLSGPLWWALGNPGWTLYGFEAYDPKLPFVFAWAMVRSPSPINELPEPPRSIPPSMLRKMGLGGLQTISDAEGNAVHGW